MDCSIDFHFGGNRIPAEQVRLYSDYTHVLLNYHVSADIT